MLPTSFSVGWYVGNVMSLKSPWAALLLMYPLQFPLSWWRSSFVNDVTFGCPTSDSTQAFKKAIIKFMGGSQLQHNCLAFCSPPLLCFWTVLTSFLLMFSSPSLSHSLYLAQFSFFPERETWSTYKYEPRGNFYCKYFKHFFARVKLPVFYTPNKSLRDVCYSTCSPLFQNCLILSCACTVKHFEIHQAWKLWCKANHSLLIIEVRLVCLFQEFLSCYLHSAVKYKLLFTALSVLVMDLFPLLFL